MTTADAVRAAANPQAALLHIAEALDRIEDALAHNFQLAESDPWGAWDTVSHGVKVDGRLVDVVRPAAAADAAPVRDEALVTSLRELLAATSDGDDRRALEARLRLADDTGIIPAADYTEAGQSAAVQQDEDTVLVELPPADPTRRSQRKAWAEQVRLGTIIDPPIDEAAAVDAYVKGGPLWLYYGNDELVRTLPHAMKTMMVADIEQDSPRTAQEIARDILKDDLEDSMGNSPTSLAGLPGELV